MIIFNKIKKLIEFTFLTKQTNPVLPSTKIPMALLPTWRKKKVNMMCDETVSLTLIETSVNDGKLLLVFFSELFFFGGGGGDHRDNVKTSFLRCIFNVFLFKDLKCNNLSRDYSLELDKNLNSSFHFG